MNPVAEDAHVRLVCVSRIRSVVIIRGMQPALISVVLRAAVAVLNSQEVSTEPDASPVKALDAMAANVRPACANSTHSAAPIHGMRLAFRNAHSIATVARRQPWAPMAVVR